jgi:hypothetical protein
MQLQGVSVNDDEGLEREADRMGEKVVQRVKTIAIETALLGGHIHTDAQRADSRKQNTRHGGGGRNITYLNFHLGFGNIPNMAGQLNVNELLLIVSHGNRPIALLPFLLLFGDKTPTSLAQQLWNSGIFPIGYHGQIYLDGCHTGEPAGTIGDGTSYAERFKQALVNLSGNPHLGGFTVKGNLGAASTNNNAQWGHIGTELISMDPRTTTLVTANMATLTLREIVKATNHLHDFPGMPMGMRRGKSAKVTY